MGKDTFIPDDKGKSRVSNTTSTESSRNISVDQARAEFPDAFKQLDELIRQSKQSKEKLAGENNKEEK